jgi:hypothetical protein
MIPVIINNRDLLTWTKSMVDKIKTLDNVGDIIIVDNSSTYQPLLDWYETKPCEIIKINNLGHTAPWESGLISKLNKPYVVTDPDLGIDNLPKNTLIVLEEKLKQMSDLGKIGLKLDWESVKNTSPYYNHLQTYDRTRWANSRIINDVYIDVHIDTTFALYNTINYFIGGGSLNSPYIAKHYPWEFTHNERNNNEEFSYYINNASNASSYKVYLNL